MGQLNLASVIDNSANKSPSHIFVRDGDKKTEYGSIARKINRFANLLVKSGVRAGDKIAIFLPNNDLLPTTLFGIIKSGAVAVPINILTPSRALAEALTETDCKAIVTIGELYGKVIEGVEGAPNCRTILLARPIDSEVSAQTVLMEKTMDTMADDFAAWPTSADDPAFILFTSGTTGRQKGAVISHWYGYFLAQVLARDMFRLNSQDTIMMIASNSNITGLAMLLLTSLVQGTLSMVAKFSPDLFFRTIEEHKITFFAGIPAMGSILLQHPHAKKIDMGSLRRIFIGGSHVPVELIKNLEEQYSMEVVTGYGMTEALPVTLRTVDMKKCPPESCGKPAFDTKIKIVDDEENSVSVGVSGEILVSGPMIFSGYYRKNGLDTACFSGEWFKTGDIGEVDIDGNLYFIGRKKERIKVHGNSVFPAELERIIAMHPCIGEVAVIGQPYDDYNESIEAFVVVREGHTFEESEVVTLCKEHLAPYKIPKKWFVIKELPKNFSGKIMKWKLSSMN